MSVFPFFSAAYPDLVCKVLRSKATILVINPGGQYIDPTVHESDCEIIGPFLYLQFNTENLLKKTILFLPNYMVINQNQNFGIECIPIREDIINRYVFLFGDSETCFKWQTVMIESINLCQDIIPDGVPANLPIQLSDSSGSLSPYYQMMVTLTSIKLNLDSSRNLKGNKTLSFPGTIQAQISKEMGIITSCEIQNPFGELTYILGHSKINYMISCDSRDMYMISLMKIFEAIKSLLKREDPPNIFCSPIKSKSVEKIPMFQTICIESKKAVINDIQPYSPHFRKVSIPKKASSSLELLFFENPVKRRMIIQGYNQSQRGSMSKLKKKQKSCYEVPCHLFSFDLYRQKLLEAHTTHSIHISTKFVQSLPFIVNDEEYFAFFEQTKNNIISNGILLNPVVNEYMKRFFKSSELINPMKSRGKVLISRLSSLLIIESEKNFSKEKLCDIISIVSSTLVHEINCHDYISLFRKYSNESISKLFPNTKGDLFGNLCIFLSRVIYIGQLYFFLIDIISDKVFRNSNYKPHSLMRDSVFLEEFQAVLKPLQYLKGKTIASFKNIKMLSSLDSADIYLHYLCISINDSILNGVEICSSTMTDIVDNLFNFLNEGYSPDFSAILQMKSLWYLFILTSGKDEGSKEIFQLPIIVKSLSMDSKTLDSKCKEAIKLGLCSREIWKWIPLFSLNAEKFHLYKHDSPLLDKHKVVLVTESIYYIIKSNLDFSLI